MASAADAGQTEEYVEQYKTWKKATPFLYDVIVSHTLERCARERGPASLCGASGLLIVLRMLLSCRHISPSLFVCLFPKIKVPYARFCVCIFSTRVGVVTVPLRTWNGCRKPTLSTPRTAIKLNACSWQRVTDPRFLFLFSLHFQNLSDISFVREEDGLVSP